MALQKLPFDVQSVFCASTQICSYKKAVEELVYNSLDAESTSIAIRVNIEQNTIQVIDNGCGVPKCNFGLIGQRNATSRCVDLSTLKSVPNKYGYRGRSLASIIEVSQSVKITSRCKDSEETWIKSFYEGKEQKLCQTIQRSSKGTTIDIKDFLYNLIIQKKAVDSLNELNDIRAFLEHLSLVHNNISLSLRDDTKHAIVFKLHKNRDIYQTLTSMFEIDRKDLQELKVEKNDYKLFAFIGKKYSELSHKHWLYLNGRFLQDSNVQKIINDNLIKNLGLNLQNKKKLKSKIRSINQEEDCLNKNGIPFYFIFITCPYYDYDINHTSQQTVLEFKNWDPINKLIEKMAKFYVGDINMKDVQIVKNKVENQQKTDDTRDQVKKIMDKILRSNKRKIGVSQMQNGIKGKITKRKLKKNAEKICVSKLQLNLQKKNRNEKVSPNPAQPINEQSHCNISSTKEPKINKRASKKACEKTNKIITSSKVLVLKRKAKKRDTNVLDTKTSHQANKVNHKKKDKTAHKDNNNIRKKEHETIKEQYKDNYTATINNKYRRNIPIKNRLPNQRTPSVPTKKQQNVKYIVKKVDKPKVKSNNLLKIFVEDPTGSVKRRCNILANKVDDLISYKNKRNKRKIFINETIQYSNIIRNNKNYSVRKKIGEIVIHDYISKPHNVSPCTFDDRVWNKTKKKPHKSSYDLVQTILRTQDTKSSYTNQVHVADNNHGSPEVSVHPYNEIPKPDFLDLKDDTQNVPVVPRLTYESHNYVERCNQISHNYYTNNYENEKLKQNSINARFITSQSRENFVIPTTKPKKNKNQSKIKHIKFQSNKMYEFSKLHESHEESSYTIEFSKSNENNTLSNKTVVAPRNDIPIDLNETHHESITCTSIERSDKINKEINLTYTQQNHQSTNVNINNEENRLLKDNEYVDYIEDSTEGKRCKQLCQNGVSMENVNLNITNSNDEEHIMNVVFISKSQEQQTMNINKNQISLDRQINPLNVCEIVHSQDDFKEHDTNRREWNDSLFNDDFYIDSFLCDRNAYTQDNLYELMDADDILDLASLNFDARNVNDLKSENLGMNARRGINETKSCGDLQKGTRSQCNLSDNFIKGSTNAKDLLANKRAIVTKDTNHFNLKNRLRFVPKGMSQIFEKCQTKNVCDYNLEKDYYEKEIYNNFANNIQLNCEIFAPGVQSVKELTTKAIEKVNNKVNKDNASLIFNGEALKQATILKQVDDKFVAAKITGKSHHSLEIADYLVLFDQHAMHERIRLENNLSGYFDGKKWKSIPLDDITLKLSKDEILYLHNYKEKFSQLGLQWTILGNSDVAINAIPEAILGKNPRQVEIIMKAVKNLIIEEINSIKSQSGCISLHPKSIIDLVFSEACRYAIKFGDHLSKNECVDLLNSLSECKTPFQCAHGRPVMAVLMDIKKDTKKYKINIKSVQKWKKAKKQIQEL